MYKNLKLAQNNSEFQNSLRKQRTNAKKSESRSEWKDKTKIYDMLSLHYISKRSVVFIVDDSYSSVSYYNMAFEYLKKEFNKLDSKDYFGFISLGENQQYD